MQLIIAAKRGEIRIQKQPPPDSHKKICDNNQRNKQHKYYISEL